MHYSVLAKSSLTRQTTAGALGGAVVALLLEPAYQSGGWTPGTLFGGSDNAFVPGVLFAGLVTAFLATADDPGAGSLGRWVKRTIGIAGMAVVLGWGYSIIAHAAFGILSGGGYGDLWARGGAWSVFGLGVGLCAGLASRSLRRAYQGCAGGLAGGFLGGAAFSLILSLGGNGPLNRFTGFTLLGAAVGLATALAEHLSRQVWITFLNGRREGRQLVLHRDECRLGRDELADIPLFGNGEIEPEQAIITLSPRPLIREVGTRSLLLVNGAPTREAPLHDGSVFEIGEHRFRFELKVADPLPDLFEPVPNHPSSLDLNPESDSMHVRTTREAATRTASTPEAVPLPEGGLILRVMAGGAAGRQLRLSGTSCTIGRELDNTLPLPDPKVSRYHAQIMNLEGAWMLTDLGSTNGTRMNGLHITRAGLAPGDFLYFGDTAVAVESAAPVRARDAASAIQASR